MTRATYQQRRALRLVAESADRDGLTPDQYDRLRAAITSGALTYRDIADGTELDLPRLCTLDRTPSTPQPRTHPGTANPGAQDDILAALARGPATHRELIAATGRPAGTIGPTVSRLRRAGRVHVIAGRPGARGRPPAVYALTEARA